MKLLSFSLLDSCSEYRATTMHHYSYMYLLYVYNIIGFDGCKNLIKFNDGDRSLAAEKRSTI